MRITQAELIVVLERHLKWRRGEEGGERANLRDADLGGADLRGADLGGANLGGANLGGADLRGADLRGADLRDANLRGANLGDANLGGANLRGANLRGAYEKTPAEYAALAAEFREEHPDIPVVVGLVRLICEIVNSGQGKLKMNDWHACETTHCRAGWAIHLAGEAGYALEENRGPEMAGGMIYRASTGRWPNFFASDADALADICAWGNLETGGSE